MAVKRQSTEDSEPRKKCTSIHQI